MLRLVLFLAFIIALASGLAWLADRPGLIVVNWEGYQVEITVFHAVVAFAFLTGLALVAWSILRHVWESPAVIGNYFNKRSAPETGPLRRAMPCRHASRCRMSR